MGLLIYWLILEIPRHCYVTKDVKPLQNFPVNSSQFDDNTYNHENLSAKHHHLSLFLHITELYALVVFGAAMVECWNKAKFLEVDTI